MIKLENMDRLYNAVQRKYTMKSCQPSIVITHTKTQPRLRPGLSIKIDNDSDKEIPLASDGNYAP